MRTRRIMNQAGVTAVTLVFLLAGCSGRESVSLQQAAQNRPASGELLRAVASENAERTLALLVAGADINESQGEGEQKITPLLAAIATKNSRIIELLIRNGAAKNPEFMGYPARDYLIFIGDEQNAALIGN